jgi:hypothetical protein
MVTNPTSLQHSIYLQDQLAQLVRELARQAAREWLDKSPPSSSLAKEAEDQTDA